MRRVWLICLFIAAVFLSNCGSSNKQGDKSVSDQVIESERDANLNEKDQQEKLVEAFEILDKRMQKMVATAKKGGPEAMEFLASDLFLKANDSSMRGDSHTAAYLYKQLLELKPNDYYVRKKYAVELIRLGSLVEAKLVLGDLLKESKYEEETLGLILGGVLTALNEIEDAQGVYKNVLKKHPASEEACVFLAKSYTLEKKYSKAHGLLKNCSKKSKKAIFSYYRAKVFLKQGKKKTAEKLLRKTLKGDPEYYQAAMALGLLKEDGEKFEEAIAVYEAFLKKNPRSYPVLSRLVQVLFANEMFEKVLPYAERLSSLDQSDLNLRVRLGILYTDAKQYDKAIGVFKEILAAVPSSDKVLYYLGSLYQQTSEFEKALESFHMIPEDSPLYVDSSMQIAQILQSLVQVNDDKWSQKYRDFLSQRSGTVEALKVEFQMMLATYFEGLKDYGRAIASIEKVRHQGDYTEGHDYYLASLYEKVKNFKKARNIVGEILDKNPKNAHALNFLGYSLLENNEDLERAYSLIRKAVELKPEDGYIRDSLGWYYYKTGQLDKALKEVTRAFDLVKTDVVIAKHLAIIYRDLKKYKKAKRFLVEALKNCKFESERREVMEELGALQDVRLPASSQ